MFSTVLGVGEDWSRIFGFPPRNIDHLAGECNADNAILEQGYEQEDSEYPQYMIVNLQVCSTAILNGLNLPANSFIQGRDEISINLLAIIG